jgi:hypothetical protein
VGRVAHGAGPVVHDDLAGGYAVSERFGKRAITLRNVLDQDRSLRALELLLLENHFHVLQRAYFRLKGKHRGLPTDSVGSPPLNHDASRARYSHGEIETGSAHTFLSLLLALPSSTPSLTSV